MADLDLVTAASDALAAYDAIGPRDAACAPATVIGLYDALHRLRKVLARSGDNPAAGVLPRTGELKHMDLWVKAAPASNAANDARDLSMVLARALGTHDLGFGPDELAALYTVAGMVTERVTEAADRVDAVCELLDPPAHVTA